MFLRNGPQAALVTFDGFSPGSVNGQGGWTTTDEWGYSVKNFDQEVVDDGSGNFVWRVSNAVTNGGFSDQPSSHTASAAAGETGSALYNDRGPDHTSPLSPPNPGASASTPYFHARFDFRSATGLAQTGLRLGVSAAAKQSPFRNSFFNIVDDGANGFDIAFYDTGTSSDPFGAAAGYTELASNLSYSDWHTVEMYIEFVDGLAPSTMGNDIVTMLINGNVVYTGSTWESYYASNPNPGISPHLQAVDSLMFQLTGTAQTQLSGDGFFFDNVLIDNEALTVVPEPGSIAAMLSLIGFGAGAIVMRRRRAKKLAA